MHSIDLNGQWQLTYAPQETTIPQTTARPTPPPGAPTIPAAVPGNVELDLMTAGILPDLTVGDNIYLLRTYEQYEWWYHRTFAVPHLEPGQSALLVFEGLDCLGTIWLDDRPVGRTDNMLIAHRFDVTELLRDLHSQGKADASLMVHIASAVLHGRRRRAELEPLEYAFDTSWEALNVRKAPHMYGWDIMPRAVSAGLWRGVHLDLLEPTHWQSVYWATLKADPAARTATLLVDWQFATDRRDVDDLRVRVRLDRAGRAPFTAEYPVVGTRGRAVIDLAEVDLWWPRGYGEPALYDARIELLEPDGVLVDAQTCRIGLRTVALQRSEVTTAEEPGDFVYIVNGERIYAKGTNWVPLDAFHARDPQHLQAAIDMAADLHCNMIRCWGGNVYEDHAFFDLCDQNGILVWQDFALACAIYPQTDEFAGRIRAEAEAVVAKLRNHPSLALWAGNNEIDEMYVVAGMNVDPNTDRLSRQVLPAVVRRLDPVRPYLPSSPYRSPELVRRGNDMALQPEQHLWGPRDDFKGPFYTGSRAHFVSEIGYHGCPDRRSLEAFLEPDFLWPWQENEQWLTHATRPHRAFTGWNYRIPLMARQTAVLFAAVPEDLDDFILASQIVQAEAKKFFIEWWRQGKPYRTGMLWWNLRDGWPIISDAIVDYYGRRKLAYAYIQRSQADLCALVAEPGDGLHPVVIVNDTRQPAAGRIRVRDLDSGVVLLQAEYETAPGGITEVGRISPAIQPTMWLIEYTAGSDERRLNHYLAGPRPYQLADYRRWLAKLELPATVGPARP